MRLSGIVGLVIAIGLAACRSDGPSPLHAYGDLATADTPGQRLSALNALDTRVNAVGYRLAVANLDLCPDSVPLTGMLLHAETQYAEALRPAARQDWHLDGDRPGVAAVAQNSPAWLAGLRPGDLILFVNGAAMMRGDPGRAAGFDGLSANLARLDAALADGGPVRLHVRRGDQDIEITLSSVLGCAYPFQVDPATELNARADGKRVFISSALAALTQTDDDLAVILGHELAHNILKHREFFDERGLARSVLGNFGNAPWELIAAEREADRVGLYLMARAGYDPRRAPLLWQELGEAHPRFRYAQWGHPSARSRAQALEAVAATIIQDQLAGLALTPF